MKCRPPSFPAVLLCLGAVALFSGCATIVSGTHDRISVSSDPPGARVRVACDGSEPRTAGETPLSVRLLRGAQNCRISIDKDGYEEETLAITRDYNPALLFDLVAGVLVATVYDYAKGNCTIGESCESEDPHSLVLAVTWTAIPGLADFLTGGAFEHRPKKVEVTLRPRLGDGGGRSSAASRISD